MVFGGSLAGLHRTAGDELRDRLRVTALPTSRTGLRLRAAALGDEAPLVGAAELAFERVLNDPLSTALP